MKDIQNQPDYRNIPIDKVGIKGLKYPVKVLDKTSGLQSTVAQINMYVDLPHHCKGTHMSRFVEILHLFRTKVSLESLTNILEDMKNILGAKSSHIEITFPYFIEKQSPETGSKGLMDYTCSINCSSNGKKNADIVLTVAVPVTSVCPCSKEISKYGAHNQRGEVLVSTRFNKFIWIEDIVQIVEAASSCDIFSVLKREDEKYVTEKAYENPKFVEDIARDVAQSLIEDDNITWFSVSAENFESIHNHSAYAYIEKGSAS
ncbi:MAG: GTP cyclohydrolase I FolE2 [Proteobacteria bacterium]|nr:GTP cyclohydrolase I FolE2 [Pseudomonadota bacterium]MBU1389451.1 GTP cyclohydrolase I FolE2 [Pseudomonadota bacterium]MBU1541271.1 GTP cyclohydrolase I FolE2 [Pseudomonadota bacterium]MBU2480093.1 GTP cyclohydrolase I FolE2 [Pseudomonadota bacterium]